MYIQINKFSYIEFFSKVISLSELIFPPPYHRLLTAKVSFNFKHLYKFYLLKIIAEQSQH